MLLKAMSKSITGLTPDDDIAPPIPAFSELTKVR